MLEDRVTEWIIKCAFKVHNVLGAGFLEKVYENALRIETEKSGLVVRQQAPIKVLYEGCVVGEYFADLLIDDRVVVELKAVQALAKDHEQQLVHYLNATGIEMGLLINFGSSVQVRRKYRQYKPSSKSC